MSRVIKYGKTMSKVLNAKDISHAEACHLLRVDPVELQKVLDNKIPTPQPLIDRFEEVFTLILPVLAICLSADACDMPGSLRVASEELIQSWRERYAALIEKIEETDRDWEEDASSNPLENMRFDNR